MPDLESKPLIETVGGPLPAVRCAMDARDVLPRLDAAARRGLLAGYAARDASSFEATAFGEPFDRSLIGTIEPGAAGADASVAGSTIRFRSTLRWKMPALYAAIIAVSIWPGVWLTHSMLITYFSWYRIQTWWWYLPLTIVPLLWMVPRMVRTSEAAARASALELIDKIAASVEGVVEA